VDGATIFRSFYEVVRVKLAVKDTRRIPEERGYVMKKKFYWFLFTVENEGEASGSNAMDDANSDEQDEDHAEDDGFDGLEDVNETHEDENQTPSNGATLGNIPPAPTAQRHGAKIWAVGNKCVGYNKFQVMVDCDLVSEEDVYEEIMIDVADVTGSLLDVALAEDSSDGFKNGNAEMEEDGESMVTKNAEWTSNTQADGDNIDEDKEGMAKDGVSISFKGCGAETNGGWDAISKHSGSYTS
jgi:hypothetical protein